MLVIYVEVSSTDNNTAAIFWLIAVLSKLLSSKQQFEEAINAYTALLRAKGFLQTDLKGVKKHFLKQGSSNL